MREYQADAAMDTIRNRPRDPILRAIDSNVFSILRSSNCWSEERLA